MTSGWGDQEERERTREVAKRAILRLTLLRWLTLAGAALAAILGGALAALLLGDVLGTPLVPTWIICSILLFAVPAVAARRRIGTG